MQNIPNGRKIDQMPIKYTIYNIFHFKSLQNLSNYDFGFENMPSGNPGLVKRSEASPMLQFQNV
jgi:hypothetical protein